MNGPKIAVVTGSNKGIGFEITRQLAQQGILVLAGVREQAKGEQILKLLPGLPVRPVLLEMTNTEHQQQIANLIAHEYGKLDILVNNAGILPDQGTKPSTIPLSMLRETFETNYFQVVSLTQLLLPYLLRSESGRIVNVSSILGSLSLNADWSAGMWELLAYNSSKAALNMFTILLAKELRGTPVKVNAAHPGWVKTDLGGKNAPLSPAEGAITPVGLATLPADGPTGCFYYYNEKLPW
ncbi:MAG: SDR family oxidoreductase [Bacteroidia bacterium]|nr:SDR family oxidoreductase [Bacteroidia bacterium]